MGKFKKGDKVIINPTLKIGNTYGHLSFLTDMKIPGVHSITDEYNDDTYTIEGHGYYYSEEMLLPVPLFKTGDKVVIRKNLKGIEPFPFGYCYDMKEYEGKTYTIKTVDFSNNKEKIVGFDECLYMLSEDDEYYSWPSVAFDLSNYKLKTENYESRLQEQESPLRGNSRELTSGVRSRVNRARVKIGTLSYEEILGRG